MAADKNVALRVSQLDAAELDSEIFQLTKTQLSKLFKYQQSNFLSNFEPEITAGLKLLIWKFTVNLSEATIGQNMLNLKYLNEHAQTSTNQWISKRQKILYACLLIGCPWLKERSADILQALGLGEWRRKMSKWLQWTETGFKAATLLNFLVFLQKGAYLSVTERLLGIRSVFPERQGIRQVSFEFMTRELLWHGFSEFLFFVLPLINYQRIKNFVLRRISSVSTATGASQDAQRNLTSCAVCGEWPIRPQEIGCPHVFCYFCIQSSFKADPSYSCPLCNHSVGDHSNITPLKITTSLNDDDDEDSDT